MNTLFETMFKYHKFERIFEYYTGNNFRKSYVNVTDDLALELDKYRRNEVYKLYLVARTNQHLREVSSKLAPDGLSARDEQELRNAWARRDPFPWTSNEHR